MTIVTVNYSTTRLLKLMLCTLAEQEERSLIERICIVDNKSVDGGAAFLRSLATTTPIVTLVERRRRLTHAHGLRAGLSAIGRVPTDTTRVVVMCDTDIIFRRADTLSVLADYFTAGVALAGEHRGPPHDPDIQASFIAVRHDVLIRPSVLPPVHDGSPLRGMQRSIARGGLLIADFAGNREGFLLHRGRSGVEAARVHRPRSPYGRALVSAPHYMGVVDGETIWAEAEARFAHLLEPADEAALLDHLHEALI